MSIDELAGDVISAIYQGHNTPWPDAKKRILYAIDRLRAELGQTGHRMLKADIEETENAVRFCRDIDDVELANVGHDIEIMLKKFHSGQYKEAE